MRHITVVPTNHVESEDEDEDEDSDNE